MILILTGILTRSRIAREGSLSEGLSSSGWHMDTSIGNHLTTLIELEDVTAVGGTIPWPGDPGLCKSGESKLSTSMCALERKYIHIKTFIRKNAHDSIICNCLNLKT